MNFNPADYTILVVDDDKLMVKIICDFLQDEGFHVVAGHSYTEATPLIYDNTPNLILLDVVLPEMNGYEICQLLRNDTRTSHIPIIMLTSRTGTDDKVAGLEVGADDYITKPFEPAELLARIKRHLRRATEERCFNPLTGLPGNIVIDEQIKQHLLDPAKRFAFLYLDLDNFKAYNDVYGFLKGDEVLKSLAEIISLNVKKNGNPDDFVGHIGGDDFVAITTPEKMDAICSKIIEQFDRTIPLFYSEEDRKSGHIVTEDRQKKICLFPLMTISIAIVSNEKRPLENHWQVAEIAAGLKKYAKQLPGSIYVKDRRTG